MVEDITADTSVDLRHRLSEHPLHDLPPVPGAMVLGRWHRASLSTVGFRMEAIKFAKALRARDDPAKMLVYGRPRSGSTLLGALMGQVPGIHDAGERLKRLALSPVGLLENSAQSSGATAFVAKILTFQLLEVQRIRDPLDFFVTLRERGYHLVHLRRDTFDQALSLCTARLSGLYFAGDADGDTPREVTVDPDAFSAQLRRSALMLDYEDLLMSALPHRRIQYEDDLADADRHQATVDGLCAMLGIASGPVAARTRRTGGAKGRIRVVNLDELRARYAAERPDRS